MRKKTTYRRGSPLNATPIGNLIRDILDDTDSGNLSKRKDARTGTNIYKEDERLHYEIDLPGFSRDEIDVRQRDSKLIITGTPGEEEEKPERHYLVKGRSSSKFQEILPLPRGIGKEDELTAKFENGVLYITAPLENKDGTIEIEIE